ncbi:hypothetical protein, partial [Nocardia higoensis]|uniref:hypothetical protein n=1 Tax=Nocardia higoensis TaxID=228599 RepID=UPI0006858324
MAEEGDAPRSYPGKPWIVNGRIVTSTSDLSEREFFAMFAARPGLFVPGPTMSNVVGYLYGYDQAAHRYGRPGLQGWREWLTANHGAAPNLVWSAQVMQIAFPVEQFGQYMPMGDLTPEQRSWAFTVLFE